MQVEVSKHTEGHKVKALRPNGLPESLIKYDGDYSLSYPEQASMFDKIHFHLVLYNASFVESSVDMYYSFLYALHSSSKG
jgi:hypothetical protein